MPAAVNRITLKTNLSISKIMVIAMFRMHKALWGRMGPSGSVVVTLTFALAFTPLIIRSAFSLFVVLPITWHNLSS